MEKNSTTWRQTLEKIFYTIFEKSEKSELTGFKYVARPHKN